MKARILVIEDEMSINDLLCMNLEIAGYETVDIWMEMRHMKQLFKIMRFSVHL